MDSREQLALALNLKAQGRYAEAQRILEGLKIVKNQPAGFYAVLGDVYWEQGSLDQAIESFAKSTELRPDSETASLGLFHCLWQKGLSLDFSPGVRTRLLRGA